MNKRKITTGLALVASLTILTGCGNEPKTLNECGNLYKHQKIEFVSEEARFLKKNFYNMNLNNLPMYMSQIRDGVKSKSVIDEAQNTLEMNLENIRGFNEVETCIAGLEKSADYKVDPKNFGNLLMNDVRLNSSVASLILDESGIDYEKIRNKIDEEAQFAFENGYASRNFQEYRK